MGAADKAAMRRRAVSPDESPDDDSMMEDRRGDAYKAHINKANRRMNTSNPSGLQSSLKEALDYGCKQETGSSKGLQSVDTGTGLARKESSRLLTECNGRQIFDLN